MISRFRSEVQRGSWRWTLRLAETVSWGAAGFVFLLLHFADLPTDRYRWGLAVVAGLAVWLVVLFRVLLPRFPGAKWLGPLSLVVNLFFAGAGYALLREDLRSAELIFVPVIIATGLLTPLPQGIAAALLAVATYWTISMTVGPEPELVAGVLVSAMFVLSGLMAGLLSRELRSHYRGEQEEHRLATAVRHRLMAVLDAVDEAIVFRDRQGIARVVNTRAAELFSIDPGEHLGGPVVELLRRVARQTEDPEGFMETFQELRDDPELELRTTVEQIIPERRELRLYSGPTFDDGGTLVGRIDVYTDITDAARRASEIERLYESARKTAESYQRSILPATVPKLPRLNMVAHYVPAAGKRAVCGDFYDFVTLPDGRMGIVMGDVCGIGPVAANDAALTRYTLRSFVTEVASPDRVMRWLNGYLGSQLTSERFVRLVYCIFDPERAVLEYANAGHVPPIIYRAGRNEIEWLEEGGVALGVEASSQYKTGRIELDPGDMITFYTDGVTEAPRNGKPLGQGKLSDMVTAYGVGTPGELVQALSRCISSWVGFGDQRDDIAVVVTQVVPDELIAEPIREFVVLNEPARLSEIRAFVLSFMADLRSPVDVTYDMLLAVAEAAANATRHGRREDVRTEIRVRCALKAGVVSVTIADEGHGFDPASMPTDRLPDRFASGGRGLYLMRELMDEVEFDSGPGGTTVTLRRRLRDN